MLDPPRNGEGDHAQPGGGAKRRESAATRAAPPPPAAVPLPVPGRIGYGLAALVFILDQLAKYWIIAIVGLRERGFVEVLSFFRLTWVENSGVSMGLLRAETDLMRWGLVAVTALIAGVVAVWIAREKNRWEVLALGLVLGGALGNIVDRIRFGYVVDFLHFFWGSRDFYVFNVADAAISVGVALLLARALLVREPRPVE